MKTLKLFSWNVNGLRAVERKNALKWFEKEEPDFLCIQETKSSPEQLSERLRSPEGYHTFFSSAEKKGYSGVALYSKIKPEKVEYGFGEKKFDSEGRIIIAHYKEFVLFNIYFPNGKSSAERLKYKLDFYDAFLKKVESIRKNGNHIVMCGDVNTAHKEIDLANPKANETISGFLPIERKWIDEFISKDYIDTFREFDKSPEKYTWWAYRTNARARNVGWRIDYFFVDSGLKNKLKGAGIRADITGSDHCPIWIELSV